MSHRNSYLSEYGFIAEDAGVQPAQSPASAPADAQEKQRRAACRKLEKDHLLDYLAAASIAYKLGRLLFKDRRRTKVSRLLVVGLLTLFEPYKKSNRYQYGDRIDAHGWFSTSIEEIRQLGETQSWKACWFSESRPRFILKELSQIGFIEFKWESNTHKQGRRLLVRFRADRVLEAIDAVRFMRKLESEQLDIMKDLEAALAAPPVPVQLNSETDTAQT